MGRVFTNSEFWANFPAGNKIEQQHILLGEFDEKL